MFSQTRSTTSEQSVPLLVRSLKLSLKFVPATICLLKSMTSTKVRWSHSSPVTPDTEDRKDVVAVAAMIFCSCPISSEPP